MSFKNFNYGILILTLLFFSYIFFYNLITFQGNKFLYFFFTIISFYFVLSIFFEKKYFCEIFLGIYLWLGYWWKFSILQWINKSDKIFLSRSEGFHPSYIDQNTLNDVFFTLIVAFIALILSFKIYKFIFSDYSKIVYEEESIFSDLYIKNRKIIIFSYVFLFLFISITNLYFGIYQKGLGIRSDLNPQIVNIYKWLILFGISFVGSVIIFYEIKNNSKNYFWITFLVLFENLFIATSNLSRAMIVNSASILYGLHRNLKIMNSKMNYISLIKLIFILFLFFFISFVGSVELRKQSFEFNFLKTKENLNKVIDKKIYKKNKDFIDSFSESTEKKIELKKEVNLFQIYNIEKFKKLIKEIIYLSTKRWVGIDSMIIISENKERNLNYLLDSFNDKISYNNSYYERVFIYNFLIKKDSVQGVFPDRELNIHNKLGQQLIGVITPGFISFLNYSNNIFFIFFAVFIIGIIVMFFEKFISFCTSNNLILVSFLTHIIVYRLIHFGHLPNQTYLLFGTLIFNLLVFYLLKKLYLKIKS